jgi:hypothetical protein
LYFQPLPISAASSLAAVTERPSISTRWVAAVTNAAMPGMRLRFSLPRNASFVSARASGWCAASIHVSSVTDQ